MVLSIVNDKTFLFDPPIDGTLTGTTTPGQSVPEINGNEGVLHIPQSSKTGVSLSNGFLTLVFIVTLKPQT